MAILHVWKEIDLDDLLPLDDLPLEVVAVVGEASDSVVAVDVVADESFSDLGFFFRFLPSTVGSSMVVAAMAVRMMSGDDSFILMILMLFYLHAETKERMSSGDDGLIMCSP